MVQSLIISALGEEGSCGAVLDDPDKQFKSLAIGTGEPLAGADDGARDGSVKIERPEGTRPRGMSISHAEATDGPRKRCKTF